jgi:MFS family permease
VSSPSDGGRHGRSPATSSSSAHPVRGRIRGAVADAALAVLSLLAFGSIVVANTLWETLLQSTIPNETHSRVSTYDCAVTLVFMPLGFALWGPISDWIGVEATLLLSVAVIIASKLGVMLIPEVRAMRWHEAPAAPTGESTAPRAAAS